MILRYFSRIIEYSVCSKTICKGSKSILLVFVQVMGSFLRTLDVERKNDQKNTGLPVKKNFRRVFSSNTEWDRRQGSF